MFPTLIPIFFFLWNIRGKSQLSVDRKVFCGINNVGFELDLGSVPWSVFSRLCKLEQAPQWISEDGLRWSMEFLTHGKCLMTFVCRQWDDSVTDHHDHCHTMVIMASTTASSPPPPSSSSHSPGFPPTSLSPPLLTGSFTTFFQALNNWGSWGLGPLSLHFLLGSLIHSEGMLSQPLLTIAKSITPAQFSLLSFKHYIHLSSGHLALCVPEALQTKTQCIFLPLILCLLFVSYLKEGITIHPVIKARKLNVILDPVLSLSSIARLMNDARYVFWTLRFMWVWTIWELEISVSDTALNK